MASLIEDAVQRIKIETVWLPPIVIDKPFAPTPEAQKSQVGKLLKPKITVTAYGSPVVMKPYGEPAQNWPILKAAMIGLGTLVVINIVMNRMDRRRASRGVSGLGLPAEEHRTLAKMIQNSEIPVTAKIAMAAARRGNCDLAMREMHALERAMGRVDAHKRSSGDRSPTQTAREYVDRVSEQVISSCAVIR